MHWSWLAEYDHRPTDWQLVKLGTLISTIAGQSPDGKNVNQTREGLPFLQGNAEFGDIYPNPEFWCKGPKKECLSGDTLISVRAPVGEINRADQIYGLGRGLAALRATKMDSDYLFYAMQLWRKSFQRVAQGTTFDAITERHFRQMWVCLPRDDGEQKAIAKLFSVLDNSIHSVRESIRQAERLYRSLMQQFLSGRQRPNGARRLDSEFKPDDHFGLLPSDWQSARLKDLISRCEYGLSRAMSESGKYPIFRMNNIERGRMVATPLAYIDLSPEDFERYRVRRGDILFNRTNTVELVGKVGIFELEGNFVFASYLVRLVAKEENDPRFLNYYLNSYEGQKRIAAKVTPSIGQANVNTRSLKSVWAVKPPRDEQSAIADRLDAIFDLIKAKEQKIGTLQKLKKSLMQNLLTGRVRLPADVTAQKELLHEQTK